MLNTIRTLISNQNYFDALGLINTGIERNHTPGDIYSNELYESLLTLKLRVEAEILKTTIDVLNRDETTRSGDNEIGLKKYAPIDALSIKNNFKEVFGKINSKKIMNPLEYQGDVIINLIRKSEKLNLAFANNDFISNLDVGEHYEEYTTNKQKYVILISCDSDGNFSLSGFLNGLLDVLNNAYEDSASKIGIYISFDVKYFDSEKRKTLIQLILLVIVLIIDQRCNDNNTYFTFLFDDLKSLFYFESLYLGAPESFKELPIVKNRNALVVYDELMREYKTNNDDFRNILKRLSYFINEIERPILLTGETGVGKTHLARAIHKASNRKNGPFIEVNCGAIPETLLEAEIFGSVKGSYTGSVANVIGKLESADKGTIFLDEIHRASRKLRDSILSFIETKEFTKLGAKSKSKVETAIIFGTNKNIINLLKEKEIELDFYYRMAKREFEIPPLRNRLEDINFLVEELIIKLNSEKHRNITIDPIAVKMLKNSEWTGNIRELIHYIEDIYLCLDDDQTVITVKMIEAAPFPKLRLVSESDYQNLIELLEYHLRNWDESDGKFLDDFINPIVAKLYSDKTFRQYGRDEKMKLAANIIGLSGSHRGASPLQVAYLKFDGLIESLMKK